METETDMLKMFDTNVNLTRLGLMRNEDSQIYIDKLRGAGYSIAGRYLRRMLSDPSCLSASECELYLDNGFSIVPVFQHRSNKPELFTVENGTIDGKAALARANDLKIPQETCIYAAFDCDFTPDTIPAAVAYMRAFALPLRMSGFATGCYGDSEVLKALLEEEFEDGYSLAEGLWLTNARGWSQDKTVFNSSVGERWHIRQSSLPKKPYDGAPFEVDDDEVVDLDIAGAWQP